MVDIVTVQPLPEVGAWPASIPRLEDGWWPTGGEVDPGNDKGIMNWQAQLLATRTGILRREVDALSMTSEVVMTVGAAGDYPTITAALIEMSKRRMAFVPNGFSASIRLLAGFVMAEQVLVSGVDLSWISIVSQDPEVMIRRTALVAPLSEAAGVYPAFGAQAGGALPRIATLFTMDATDAPAARHGISLVTGSRATVAQGCGIKNAGGCGCIATMASSLSANGGIFNGAGAEGINAHGGSIINVVQGSVTGCTLQGISASNGARVF